MQSCPPEIKDPASSTDPGPSDLSCQDPGMRMNKAHWNPLVCEHPSLAFATSQEPYFFFVVSLNLSPWKKACFVFSLAELTLKSF